MVVSGCQTEASGGGGSRRCAGNLRALLLRLAYSAIIIIFALIRHPMVAVTGALTARRCTEGGSGGSGGGGSSPGALLWAFLCLRFELVVIIVKVVHVRLSPWAHAVRRERRRDAATRSEAALQPAGCGST